MIKASIGMPTATLNRCEWLSKSADKWARVIVDASSLPGLTVG
jgi:hypothetical protein